jgi:hypothetical protein
MPMCWEVTQTFPATTHSPRAARDFCTEQLAGLLADHPERRNLLEDARLIVSEPVTNALNAGSTTTSVGLDWHRHHVRLSVSDDAPGLPIMQAATSDQSHGRGLAIIASLSITWGIDPHPSNHTGKQVWAELDVSPTLTDGLNCSLNKP